MRQSTSIHFLSTKYGKFGGGLPDEYHAWSHKHGGNTIPKLHPSLAARDLKTTAQRSYQNPESLRPRLYRTTNKEEQKQMPVKQTFASGFATNMTSELPSTVFAWRGMERPSSVPAGTTRNFHKFKPRGTKDYTSTEYRARYNPEKDFHPPPFKSNARKLQKPVKV